jgi:type 1 fimbria pilin
MIMNTHHRFWKFGVLSVITVSSVMVVLAHQTEINFTRELSPSPTCDLLYGGKNLVDFGDLNIRNNVVAMYSFNLMFNRCPYDSTAHVMFTGVESSEQSGTLALNGVKGLVIHFVNAVSGSKEIKVNQTKDQVPLKKGDSDGGMNWVAYRALVMKTGDTASVTPGTFTASATIDITYDY